MPIDDRAYELALQKYEDAKAEVLKFAAPRDRPMEDIGCSFCCRPKSKIRGSVAGPGVFICAECVATCHRILREQGHIE